MQRFFSLTALTLSLSGCASSVPEFGEIDWFLLNGTGSGMTLIVHDRVCGRLISHIDLPRTGDVPITTCQDESGRSDIRYRRRGIMRSGNPWVNARVSADQVLLVR